MHWFFFIFLFFYKINIYFSENLLQLFKVSLFNKNNLRQHTLITVVRQLPHLPVWQDKSLWDARGLSFGKAVIKCSTVFARAGEGLHHHIQANLTYIFMLGVHNHLQDCFLAFNWYFDISVIPVRLLACLQEGPLSNASFSSSPLVMLNTKAWSNIPIALSPRSPS